MCHINERSYCQKANFLTSGSFPGIALKDKRIKNCLWVSCASHFVPQIIAIGSETFLMHKKVRTMNDKNWESNIMICKEMSNPIFRRDQIIVENEALSARTLVHPPQKPPITKTCIFWCKMTWGSMFTKVILLPMVESH